MNKLRDLFLDAMEKEGYGVFESLENWNKFREELKGYSKGKHKIYIGKHEISFTIL